MSARESFSATDLSATARLAAKGNIYEDFHQGQVFERHWGRTITQAENALFSTLTLHLNPHYFNAMRAKAHGHDEVLLNPPLIFNTVFGLSVEDLSDAGMGPFLGVDELSFHKPVLAGATLTARSAVIAKRETASRPDLSVVTWHTEGFADGRGRVIDFKRSNLIRKG